MRSFWILQKSQKIGQKYVYVCPTNSSSSDFNMKIAAEIFFEDFLCAGAGAEEKAVDQDLPRQLEGSFST